MVELDQAREDLRKTRARRIIYTLLGAGLVVIGIVLVVLYLDGREMPTLVLGIASFFWAAMILFQAVKTRDLEVLILARVEELTCPGDGAATEPAVPEGEGGAGDPAGVDLEYTGAGDSDDGGGAGEEPGGNPP